MCYFFRFDSLKIHYLTSNLNNFMNHKINLKMSESINNEVELSGDDSNGSSD